MDKMMRADLTEMDPVIRDVMLSGRINALMPLSCLTDGGRVYGIYSTEDEIPVKEGRFSPVSILELVGRILNMTEELKDYLIFPEDMVFSMEMIFIDTLKRRTRMCVVPELKDKKEKECVSYLLDELKCLTDEKGSAYLEAFRRIYNERCLGTKALLSVLEDMKKEAGKV